MNAKNHNRSLFHSSLVWMIALALVFASPVAIFGSMGGFLQEQESQDQKEVEEDENLGEQEEDEHEDEDEQDDDVQEDEDDQDEENEFDEEEFEEEISDKEVIDFAKKHFPKMAEELVQLLEDAEESEEEYEFVEEMMDRGRELIHEYRHINEAFGESLGKKFLKMHELDWAMEGLIVEFHESDDEEDREKIKSKIEGFVKQRYDFDLELGKAELELFRKEIKELESELKERKSNRDEMIKEEVEGLLSDFENDEFEDDDLDDDDRDDDDLDDDDGEESEINDGNLTA